MRSGWFFNTPMWAEYLQEYAKSRPECLHEFRSSPLAKDQDLREALESKEWVVECHQSQVIDLATHKWSDVRKSYHSLIHRAQERCEINEEPTIREFKLVHRCAFGTVRNDRTFEIQGSWMPEHAMAVAAVNAKPELSAAALWIIYQGSAYYGSAPSVEKNILHAVIWESLKRLKARGVQLVDMGQVDGATEKEKNIGTFKAGFGGELRPFLIAKRKL